MPLFYCPSLARGLVELNDEESRHARGSRRLQPGDRIRLFDGAGTVATGRIVPPTADSSSESRPRRATPSGRRAVPTRIRVEVESIERVAPPSFPLTLLVAAPKGERLDWMIEKCTELGVAGIRLAEFDRSIVHLRDEQTARLGRLAREACKQCGRAWLPTIRAVGPFETALAAEAERSPPPALAIAHPATEAIGVAEWIKVTRTQRPAACIVIGPEGGFTDREHRAAMQRGARAVRLGPHILRVETAAIAAAAAWAVS